MANTADAAQFLIELRKRVELKTGGSGAPEKTLLDAFKYFDLSGAGTANKKAFLQVMKIRIGITSQTEESLERMFDSYSQGGNTINYREFISKVFDSKMNLSLREPPLPPDPSHIVKDKNDLVYNEEQIKKTIDYVIYKLRSGKLQAFFQLFKELKAAESGPAELSQSALSVGLKRLAIDISQEEIQRLFYTLANDRNYVQIDRLMELFTKNYNNDRRKSVQNAYSKFDYMKNGKVSLQLVKELFSAKNTFAAREGRLSPEEVSAQFAELLDGFSKLNGNNFVVDLSKFERMFSFISAQMKEDKEFYHFVDNCFRYSDLPQAIDSTKNTDKANTAKMDELSIKTCGLEDLFNQLISQLNQRGNRAYIQLYKTLKCNDFDNDGFVFEKEFEKSINEVRLQFNQKQVSRLFEKFAVLRMRLDFHELMNKLVPEFDIHKKELLKEVWDSLTPTGAQEVLFETVTQAFHARSHPDFRNGNRPDYEISNEFSESLKTFLNLARGNFLKLNEVNFVRFFEFFARNWTLPYLQSVLEFAFRLKGKGSVKSVGISAPYGTMPEDGPTKSKIGRIEREDPQANYRSVQASPTQGQSKLMEEYSTRHKEAQHTPFQDLMSVDPFKKKQQADYKLTAPFFTDNKENSKQFETLNNKVGASQSDIDEQRSKKATKPADTRELPNNRPATNAPKDDALQTSNIEIKEAHITPDVIADTKMSLQASKVSSQPIKDNESSRVKQSQTSFESVQEKLSKNLRYLGKIPMILQLEYDLTERSDEKGFVDLNTFVSVLEKYDLLKGITQEERQLLFQNSAASETQLHVQNFANKLRGQMSQVREREMIAVFDRMTGGQSELPMFVLKNAFLPQKFRFHAYKTMTESREMFASLLSLFEKLNLAVKDKDSFSLDDFLYLCDNFSFFISAEDEFLRLMASSFK